MKKRIFLNIIALAAILAISVPTKAQVVQPDPYDPSIKVNYLRVWDATAPETNPNSLITRSLQDVKQTSQYFDGLGRPIQTVVKLGSLETNGVNADLVNTNVYDEFGREVYKYLPFVSNGTNSNDGTFKLNPFQQQASFLATQLSGQSETYYYSQTLFEASPLNRINKVLPPGNSWVGSGRGTETRYWINAPTDNIKIWSVTNVANSFGSYTVTGIYSAGALIKIATVDEHGKQVLEFKEANGKTILKKVQLTAISDDGSGNTTDYSGWLCTYYIYDDFDNLRCVIQPKGVELLIQNSWNIAALNNDILNEQCFRYEYDGRNRMIMKKVPGAGEVYMVYDYRDRLVMTQDAIQRTSQTWLVSKYDELNRLIETGLWQSASSFSTHLTNAYNSSSYPSTSSGYELLTQTHYDDYTSLPAGLSSSFLTNWNSNFSATNNSQWPYPQMPVASNAIKGVMAWTLTKILGSNPAQYISSVMIYDDKGRVLQMQSINITGGLDVNSTQYSWGGQPLVTVQKQEKAGSSNPQTHVVVSKLTYDDLGRLLNEKKSISSVINGNSLSKAEQTILSNEYDKLGQLKIKRLGNKPNSTSGTALTNQSYEYNIRGWLLSVNKGYTINTSSGSNDEFFGMQLGYDKNSSIGTYGTGQQFNGNIAGMIWKSEGEKQIRKYNFSYDAVNRLMGADFSQYVRGSGASATFSKTAAGLDFSVNNLSYDANGNILSMQQMGYKLGGSSLLDDMRYTYVANSNKLKSVTDFVNNPQTKMGDFRTDANHPQASSKSALTSSSGQPLFDAITDYNYDANGNLILDNNKQINSITYNHLNLPSSITVTSKGNIVYIYDASGVKLKKISTDNSIAGKTITTTTNYIGGNIYESKVTAPADPNDYTDILQFVSHEEGRIRFVKATTSTCPAQPDRYIYDYFVKDHLGNVRMVLTEQKEDVCYIPATLEDSRQTAEQQIYNIDDSRRVLKSNTGATQSSFENKLYQVHGGLTNQKTGLGMVLKVMSGDQVKISAESFYTMPGGGPGTPLGSPVLNELLSAFVGNGMISSSKYGTVTTNDISNTGTNSAVIPSFLDSRTEGTNNARAFLNWMLLDEQFKYITGGSDPVQPGGGYKMHTAFINSPVSVIKNGFLYIYVSNESNFPVYFDNLSVTHTPGAIVEENHYYPFGLIQQGISSKAAGVLENKKSKYNGYDYNTDFDINLYESFYRSHDPQLGRFWQPDPKPSDMESLYVTMGNNPIKNTDFLGDTTIFYSSSGVELLRTTERELGNAVTFITDDNFKSFNSTVAEFKSNGSDFSEGCGAQYLRSMGESYDTKSAFALVDGNKKNYTTDKTFSPNDGKGPFINETSAAVEKKNGVFTVNVSKQDPKNQSPFASSKVSGDDGVTIHTHDNEGRKFKLNSTGQTGYVLSGKASVGDDNSSKQKGTGLFDMAVSKKTIYFYNSSGVVLEINRDAFDPKNFKKK